jgi:hypothetical protein
MLPPDNFWRSARWVIKSNNQLVWNRSEKGRASKRARDARYDKTEKGRARDARYDKTEKGRARDARYDKTEKGRASKRTRDARYNKTEKGRACFARYNKTEKGRARNARCKDRGRWYKDPLKQIRKEMRRPLERLQGAPNGI